MHAGPISVGLGLWSATRGIDPGLALLRSAFAWYDVTQSRVETDAGVFVSQLTDLTGNGRHALPQAGNVAYSLPKMVHGSGLVSVKGQANFNLRASWTATTQPATRYVLGRWAQDGANSMLLDGVGSTNRNAIWQNGTPRKPSLYAGTAVSAAGTAPFEQDCIVCGVFNGTSSRIDYELLSGGGVVSSGNVNTGTQANDGVVLCNAAGGTFPWLGGNVAVYAEFNRLLTASEDAQVRSYLKSLVRPVLPNYVFHGNSLTQGAGSTNHLTDAFPIVIRRLLEGQYYGSLKYGIGGYTTQQLQARIATDVIPNYAAGARNVLMIYEAGNDIYVNGTTGADAWTNIVAYKDAAIAAGWTGEIATCTIGPRTGVSEANRGAYNTAARAGWAAAGFSRLVDFGGDPALAVPAADGTHYNTAQYALLAQHMVSGLQ